MTTIDRYLVRLFAKIFAICLISFCGLFVVVDAFSNLEEFVELGSRRGGIFPLLGEYYGPRLLDFFDRTAPFLALTAAIAALVRMQRSNELAAVEAAGIPKSRMVRPLLACTLLVIALACVNREAIIPQFRFALARNAQDWEGRSPRPLQPQQDPARGVWFLSGQITLNDQAIDEVALRLPESCSQPQLRIAAEHALARKPTAEHPAGWLLQKIREPALPRNGEGISDDRGTLVFSGQAGSWLQPDELFLVTDVPLRELAYGSELQRYGSLADQVAHVRQPSAWFSNRLRVQLHHRLLRPAIDATFLFLGVPIVIARRERNIFLALGLCLLVVIGIQMLILACHSLGASRVINPAALAAWLPLILLAPIASVTIRRIDQ